MAQVHGIAHYLQYLHVHVLLLHNAQTPGVKEQHTGAGLGRWGQGKEEGVLYRIKTFNAIKYIKQGKTSMGENTMILNNS